MSALAEKMKAAGVDTNSPLLHGIAVECLRKSGQDVRKALGPFTEEVRDSGGILIALMGDKLSYEIVRNQALDYLEKIAADMRGTKVSPQGDVGIRDVYERRESCGPGKLNEGDEVHSRLENQYVAGLSSSPPNTNDAVRQLCESQREPGRVVRMPNKPRVGLKALQNAHEFTVTILDTHRIRDGRAIGDIKFGELNTIIGANRREAALLDMIRKYAVPFESSARVRDVIKIDELQRMIQKASEVSDAE